MDQNVSTRLKPRQVRARKRIGECIALAFLLVSLGLEAGEPAAPTLIVEDAPSQSLTLETTDIGDPLVVLDAPTLRFEVKAGESWHDALARWAKDSGYTLIWRAPNDLLVEAPIVFDQGTTFEGAVDEVLRTLWRTRNGLVGSLYRNRVIVITGRNP